MQPFEDVFIENLENCPNGAAASGLQVRVCYAPESYFHGIVLTDKETFVDSATIQDGDMEFVAGKAWGWFNALVDESELKTILTGPALRKKFRTQLDLYILGFNTTVIGFLERVANVPLVFAVIDANGTPWIVGTKRNAAIIDKADGTTGKAYIDNSGFAATISANTMLYRYAGDVQDFNRTGGEFNTDFNNDFTI